MKFSLAPLALLALAGMAIAQDPAPSSSSSSSVASSAMSSSASSSAAPSSSSSQQAQSTPAPNAGGQDNDGSSCALLPGYEEGKPLMQQYGCTQNASTSTPVYDSTKLQSYLIGQITKQKEGKEVETVAHDLAKSAVKLYPTLTVPLAEIQESYETAISASIEAIRDGRQELNGALALNKQAATGLYAVAAAGVAVVAGGAFLL
ncbi:unnamed protein product [Sympodiomycopsis kandeliae]